MKSLQEALRKVNRLDDTANELPNDELDDDALSNMDIDTDGENDEFDDENDDENDEIDMSSLDDIDQSEDPENPDDQEDFDPNTDLTTQSDLDQEDDQPDEETDDTLDSVVDKATENPNKVGVIRTVPKAHLIYKRASENGGYEELWMYNIGDYSHDLKTKQAILSGTDIPVNKTSSEDGKQSYTMWSAGNAELIHIVGLPN